MLVAVAAGVAMVLVVHVLRGIHVTALWGWLSSAVPVLVALGGGVLVVVAVRGWATRRALRSRVTLCVVPADEFDPSPEEVVRFASQLQRVRRGVRSWLDRRASAVRVVLASDRDGRLAYLLQVPARAAELVRAALRGFEGVEVHDSAGPLSVPGGGRHVGRAELVLARASVEPLARLELDPDPLQAFATALQVLRADAGDRAVVCLDLLPASSGEAGRLRRRLLREARRCGEGTRLVERLTGGGRGQRAAASELAERRAESRALDQKLSEPGALFRLQLLVRCDSVERARAQAALRSLLGAFDQLAARNWLRVSGVQIPGLAFLGSDVPGRRWWFDRRLRRGLFRPARDRVVTARELAAFLKPPTVRCGADNVLRCGPLVAPTPELPEFCGQHGLIPLGRVASARGERLVGVRVQDTFFSYAAGRSRYGKTELALAQFLHLVCSGHGGLFLDPHEDAIVRIKRHLAERGLAGRVIEINLARPASERQPAWNLFELAGRGQAEDAVEAIVDACASALRWDERNNRALNLTTQAAQALAQIARVLPAELAPTIFQLPTLLSDQEWRAACLPFLLKASQRFWSDRFPRLAEEAITPVTNLIDRLRASRQITALLGQSQSTYRVREAMDQGLIVLACPGSGGTRDRLIANLLVFDLLHAAKGRAELPPAMRRPFWVFLDEVQTYDGAASGNLAALLEQTAKYGVRAFLLNQNPERLTVQTLNAVTTNRSHLLATALNARAGQLVAKEWGGRPEARVLTRLPRYRFLCQVTHQGELTKPFLLRALPADELLAIDKAARRVPTGSAPAADRSLPVEEALAHLDSLDERILKALIALRRGDSDRSDRDGADAHLDVAATAGGLEIPDEDVA